MGDSNKNTDDHDKYGSMNGNPIFMQNGNRRVSGCDYNEISNFRKALPQFLAVSVKNTLLFVYGMTLGFPTIVIPAIQGGDGHESSDIILNRDEISWFSSINLICVPLGCLFSGFFSHPIGKRRAMQIVNLPILASWLLFHFSTKTEHLYAALCLSGLGGGLMEAPVLTYVAEITEPKYRGILSALGSTCVITGIFVQFIMGSIMDWRTIAAVSSAFPVISIVALFFVPESPTWLIRQHKFKEAVKSLQWLRGWIPQHMVEKEFNTLYEQLIKKPAHEEAEEALENKQPTKCEKRMKMFRKRTFWFPFMLVAFTFFVGHFSGKTTLQTYAVQIFHTLKAPINKYHATILLGVAELIATILCVVLIRFTGKRPLVLISTIGCCLCFFGTATYAHFLKIVPGFAINNVVVNASSLLPVESVITVNNITHIFETEEKALQLRSAHENLANLPMTTILPSEFLSSENLGLTKYHEMHLDIGVKTENRQHQKIHNKTKELIEPSVMYNRTFTNEDGGEIDEALIHIDVPTFDYSDFNETEIITAKNSTGTSSKETQLPPFEAAVIHADTNTMQDSSLAHEHTVKNVANIPSSTQVVNDILLPVPQQQKNHLVWIPLILLLGSAFFAHLGIRIIPWILIGEVFPASVRSTASGLVSAVGYIFGFLANKLFLQMLATLTMPGTFWFYSGVALLGAIVLFFILPETEGRHLREIEEHFSKKSPYRLKKQKKASPIAMIDNLQDPPTSMDTQQSSSRIIRLQQSDLIHNFPSTGQINPAFDNSSNTTHL